MRGFEEVLSVEVGQRLRGFPGNFLWGDLTDYCSAHTHTHTCAQNGMRIKHPKTLYCKTHTLQK